MPGDTAQKNPTQAMRKERRKEGKENPVHQNLDSTSCHRPAHSFLFSVSGNLSLQTVPGRSTWNCPTHSKRPLSSAWTSTASHRVLLFLSASHITPTSPPLPLPEFRPSSQDLAIYCTAYLALLPSSLNPHKFCPCLSCQSLVLRCPSVYITPDFKNLCYA